MDNKGRALVGVEADRKYLNAHAALYAAITSLEVALALAQDAAEADFPVVGMGVAADDALTELKKVYESALPIVAVIRNRQ